MTTLSRAARLPTLADIPALSDALVEQTDAILANFEAMREEAAAYHLLAQEIRSVRQIAAVITGLSKVAEILGLRSANLKKLTHLSNELELQLQLLDQAAMHLDTAFGQMQGRIEILRPLLDDSLKIAADAPITAPGALIALRQIEATSGETSDDPSLLQQRAKLVANRADEIATQVMRLAGVLRDWVVDIVALRIATDGIVLACRSLRSELILLSQKDIRALTKIGALADQAAAVAEAIQLLKVAIRGAPRPSELNACEKRGADALGEILEAAVDATVSLNALARVAAGITDVAETISGEWSSNIDHAKSNIDQRKYEIDSIQSTINMLLTRFPEDNLQPSIVLPSEYPYSLPVQIYEEKSIWQKIVSFFF